jgi:hypothetical protein
MAQPQEGQTGHYSCSSHVCSTIPPFWRDQGCEKLIAAQRSIVANNQAGLIGLIELDGHVTGQSSLGGQA